MSSGKARASYRFVPSGRLAIRQAMRPMSSADMTLLPGVAEAAKDEISDWVRPGCRIEAAMPWARPSMASLPDGTNLYEALAIPLEMAFLGRG